MKKSKADKGVSQKIIIVVLLAVIAGIVIFGVGYLNLGSWYLPTEGITVDTEGIHIRSTSTESITWNLENEARTPVSSLVTNGFGHYTFSLPATSGKYHIYCTTHGCDAGEWILIDLTKVPLSAADTIITGWCDAGNGNVYSCTGKSRDFPYSNWYRTPNAMAFFCNTCNSRDIYKVASANNAAVFVTAPPIPEAQVQTTTPPIGTPVITTIPPTQPPIGQPVVTTIAPDESVTTLPVQTTQTNNIPGTTTPTEQTPAKGMPFIGIVGMLLITGASYFFNKNNNTKRR